MNFSMFVVLILSLVALYLYIMKMYDIKKKEVEEKIEEKHEYDELAEKATEVDVKDLKKKREKVNEVRKA